MSTIILYFSIYASEQEIVVVVIVHYPLLPRNTRYDYSHNVICAIGTNCCYVMNNSELLVPHVCNHRLRRDYFPCRLIYEQTSWRLDTMMMMVFVSATWWFLHSPVERIGRSTTNSAASSSFHGCFLTYQIIRIVVTAFTARSSNISSTVVVIVRVDAAAIQPSQFVRKWRIRRRDGRFTLHHIPSCDSSVIVDPSSSISSSIPFATAAAGGVTDGFGITLFWMSSTLFWFWGNVLRRRGSGIIIMVMIIVVCSSTTITTAMMKIGRGCRKRLFLVCV